MNPMPFTGQTSQTVTLDAATQTLTFAASIADIAQVTQTVNGGNVTVVITLDNGNSLTVTTNIAALAARPSAIVLGGENGAGNVIFAAAGTTTTGSAGTDLIIGANGVQTIDGGGGINVIFGGQDSADGGDLLTGGSDVDFIFGAGGTDTINTLGGGGFVVGGQGGDSITAAPGGSAPLLIFGDSDLVGPQPTAAQGQPPIDFNDTINIGSSTVPSGGSATVFGNFGNDTVSVFSTTGATVFGGQGADSITFGGAGTLAGGNNFIDGGRGVDSITVTGNGNNTIFGGTGEAAVPSETENADTIAVTGSGNNTIFGNLGADIITLNGAGGPTGALGTNLINGGQGADQISVFGGQIGTNGGATAALQVFGAAGADVINTEGYTGNATIYGGSGPGDSGTASADAADTIRAGNGNDAIRGNAGIDVITTGAGSDTIYGGEALDRIIINDGGGTNSISSTTAAGNKVIADFQTGEQVFINGGTTANSYTASVSGAGGDVVLTTAARTITFTAAQNSVVNVGFDPTGATTAALVAGALPATSVLLASFGTTATTLTGLNNTVTNPVPAGTAANPNSNGDRIFSGAAADTIIGGGGSDTVFAGAGADSIDVSGGNAGVVSISGGAGNDTISTGTTFVGGVAGTSDSIDGGDGVDVLNVGATGTINASAFITNVEQIVFTGNATTVFSADDANVAATSILTVDATANTTASFTFNGVVTETGRYSVLGGGGDDTLYGGASTDTLTGNAGADDLYGFGGNDTISGGAGADDIFGGVGADSLTGGDGVDIYTVAAGESGTAPATVGGTPGLIDIITDLNLGTNAGAGSIDEVRLTGITAVGTTNFPVAPPAPQDGLTDATAFIVNSFDVAINALANGATALFRIGGQTYLVADGGGESTTFSAGDFAIQVTGVQGTLDTSDLA